MCKEKVTTIEQLIAKTAKKHEGSKIGQENALCRFLDTNRRPDRDNLIKRRTEERILRELREDLESIFLEPELIKDGK